MQEDETDYRALALAEALLRDLRIDPAFLDGVASNLALLHRHAGHFMRFDFEARGS